MYFLDIMPVGSKSQQVSESILQIRTARLPQGKVRCLLSLCFCEISL